MLSVPDITRMRRRQREHAQRNPSGRIALGCGILLSLFLALSSVAFALVYTDLTRNLPSLETLPLLLEPPNGLLLNPTTLYDRTGEHVILKLENPATTGRLFLTTDDSQTNFLPGNLISATLATTDPTFWQSPGYSLDDLDQDSHSTLAQRLVADLLLWNESSSIRRNLRERLLAAQVTNRFGREKVLTWYLNSVNYGRLAYGADAGSRVYFGKPAAMLNLAEAAVLAAVAETPSLNPLDAPQAALDRGKEVIFVMLAQGLITSDKAEEALQSNILFQPESEPTNNVAPAFANLVIEQLGKQFDVNRLERGGLRVITTLNYDLQNQTNCASIAQLARLEDTSGQTPTTYIDDCQAARLLPSLPPSGNNPPQNLGANVVLLDPKTAQILAMVGEASSGMDPSHTPGHPPGSLLTPLIYMTGFTQGLSPASLVWDIPSALSNVQNPDGSFHGPVRLRVAMANDYIVPAEQVYNQIGAEKVWKTARQLGMVSADLPQGNSANAILEEGEITLLELSRAYGVFGNQGILVGMDSGLPDASTNNHPEHAVAVLLMEDFNGTSWYSANSPQLQPVISPQLAYLITNILSDETARWPSMGHPNSLEIGKPVAAKLGRTATLQDAWTIGYTPNLVVAVWIGHRNESSTGIVSTNGAAALWHAIIQYATQDQPSEGWTIPVGVNSMEVCDPSGMLPTADCPNVVGDFFLAGYEPTQVDTLYRSLQINRETGKRATVFTPSELVEERIFLLVPPEAKEWAYQAGLPTPPEEYDVILTDSRVTPSAQIISPQMFAYVRGMVSVTGTADGDNFDYYRLQVGKGLNPRKWLKVGEDVANPVVNDKLGVWDARKLSGLYAIQLLVVDHDQHIETTTIHVTVDNQPPEVEIKYPSNGQNVDIQNDIINLQVNIDEYLALESVEFYIDNQLIRTLRQPPYSIPWQTKTGKHTLRIIATDLAGNKGEASIDYFVKE